MNNYKATMWLAATALIVPTAVSAEELSSAAKSVQNTLNKLTVNSSEDAVHKARTLYSNLSEDDQYAIYDVLIEKLIPLEAKFYNEDMQQILANKETVTLTEVEALLEVYDTKEWEFQELVQELYDQTYELLTYIENRPYKEAAEQFMQKLNVLDEGTITQQKYEEITLIYNELDYMSYDYFDSAAVDEKLERLQTRLYYIEAQEVQKLINRADEATITQDHLDIIVSAYDNLSYEAQQTIRDYEKIERLQDYIWAAPVREEAKRLQALINNVNEKNVNYITLRELIDEITYADEEVYELLTGLSNLEMLLVLAKKNEAATVQALIDEIDETNVTSDALATIEDAYALLDYEVQQVVTNYEKVDALTQYILNEEIAAMDVDTLIFQLTVDSTVEELNAARQKLEQLSVVAKTFISAETIDALNLLYLQKEAAVVQVLIDAIDETNITSDALVAIEEAYVKLAPNAQQLVVDYEKVAQLKQYMLDEQSKAEDIEVRIMALTNSATFEDVEVLRQELNSLSVVAQSLIATEVIKVLQERYDQLLAANNNEEATITTVNHEIANIWNSDNFSSKVNEVKQLVTSLSQKQQEKLNSQTLLRYEQMATYWNNKTKKWTGSPKSVVSTKEWTITFSEAILNTPENLSHIKVFNEKGDVQNIVTIVTGQDKKQLVIKLKDATYTSGEQYVLIINSALKSDKDTTLTNGVWQYFDIK
ncbi:hypothetical protein [Caryophanon tenue]|uniref:SbsA Ig-like domain-containing protein n=1 Tax=Caryophanon tenue TaxID=33978 RepID=A0A1C0YJS7_9BACL|nr:hypothetical protein [Caryophanon tenue]OCS87435.1 hypothetical protein A6M13_08945 [Caryophanon tenue]